MSKAYIAGIVCGLVLVAVVGFIIGFARGFARKKRQQSTAEYDERQEAVRGRGFKYGYVSLVAYLAVYALQDALEIYWCRLGAGLFLGFLLSVTVFVIYCIYKDAYFRVSDRPGFYAVLCALLAAANLVCGLVVPGLKGIEKEPMLGIEDINFMVAGFVFIIFINVLVKLWLDKRAEEME